jgi:hypothetical protein
MAELALARVKVDDTKRRVELETLKRLAVDLASAVEKEKCRQTSRGAYHGGKLPVEIFGEIFDLVVTRNVTEVITISHVCKHWRTVALGMPSLWRTLILVKKDPVNKMKEWIKRSEGRIRELCIRSVSDGVHMIGLWNVIFLEFPWNRLQVFRLDSVTSQGMRKGFESATRILSNLVEVEYTGWVGNESRAAFPHMIANSNLQSLTLSNLHFDWKDLSGFTKLVSLVIQNAIIYSNGSHLIDVLEANPMLEVIVVQIQDHAPPRSLPQTLYRLNHLEIVCLSGHNFRNIIMPSLRILRVYRVTTGMPTLLQSVLDSGSALLTELSLRSTAVRASELIPVLRAAFFLSTLVFSYIDGEVNPIAEALANQPSSMPGFISSPLMCPRLTHIDLSGCSDLKTGVVMRLVKFRLPAMGLESTHNAADAKQGILQINTLIIDKCPLIEPEVLPWLRSNVQTVSCVYASGKDARWKR